MPSKRLRKPRLKQKMLKVHNYPCSICALCPKSHKILQSHWKSEKDEVFCEFCGHGKFSCEAIFKHIESKHKKSNIQTLQPSIFLVLLG